jgi:hypothetical protein
VFCEIFNYLKLLGPFFKFYQIQKLYSDHLERLMKYTSRERKHKFGAPKIWSKEISRKMNHGKLMWTSPLNIPWEGVELINTFHYKLADGFQRSWYDLVVDDDYVKEPLPSNTFEKDTSRKRKRSLRSGDEVTVKSEKKTETQVKKRQQETVLPRNSNKPRKVPVLSEIKKEKHAPVNVPIAKKQAAVEEPNAKVETTR